MSRLFLLFTWVPRYLRPSTNDHTHLYRGDMRADLTYFMTLVDGNHLLISASSFQIYPSSHTTRFLAFATHLADSFVYNKSYRVSLLSFSIIPDLTSHTQTRNIHRHKLHGDRYGDKQSCAMFSISYAISTFTVLWFE